MFMNMQSTISNHPGLGAQYEARKASTRLFEQAHSQANGSRLLAKILGKSTELRSLSRQPVQAANSGRVVTVPLNKIIGSEGRSMDFDTSFRPLKEHNRERWINIAVARRTGVSLPAVELVQVGDAYYVRDGNHRISVARMMGQVEIDARIVN